MDLRPAQGAFVHEPTEAEADQLLTERTLLEAEAEAARLAAADAGRPGIERLEGLCAEGEALVTADDVDGAVQADARFHAALIAAIAAIAERDEAGATRLVREHTEHTRQPHHARPRADPAAAGGPSRSRPPTGRPGGAPHTARMVIVRSTLSSGSPSAAFVTWKLLVRGGPPLAMVGPSTE